LVTAIAQDAKSGRILMVASVNRESLTLTVDTHIAHYWSRSRNRIWQKGEESGHRQNVQEIRLDCDGDALLFVIQQVDGIACHTGRESCFYRKLEHGGWHITDPVKKNPEDIYAAPHVQ
jgi:phosphoribosyl-AMP cyclohydrolase